MEWLKKRWLLNSNAYSKMPVSTTTMMKMRKIPWLNNNRTPPLNKCSSSMRTTLRVMSTQLLQQAIKNTYNNNTTTISTISNGKCNRLSLWWNSSNRCKALMEVQLSNPSIISCNSNRCNSIKHSNLNRTSFISNMPSSFKGWNPRMSRR